MSAAETPHPVHPVRSTQGFSDPTLNHAECVIVHDGGPDSHFVTALMLSGPHAGHEWQIGREHLTPAP